MSKKNRAPIVVAVVAGVCVTSLAAYMAVQPKNPPINNGVVTSQNKPGGPDRPVKVLTPRYEGSDLKLDEKDAKAPEGTDGMVHVINTYLDQVPAVPKDARLKTLTMDGGTAMLSFSSSFERTYGTDDEQTIIKGVLSSLAQFPEVKKAKFLVEGKPMETIGNVDLTEPLDVEKS